MGWGFDIDGGLWEQSSAIQLDLTHFSDRRTNEHRRYSRMMSSGGDRFAGMAWSGGLLGYPVPAPCLSLPSRRLRTHGWRRRARLVCLQCHQTQAQFGRRPPISLHLGCGHLPAFRDLWKLISRRLLADRSPAQTARVRGFPPSVQSGYDWDRKIHLYVSGPSYPTL